MSNPTILLVHPPAAEVKVLSLSLHQRGIDVVLAESASQALDLLADVAPSVVILHRDQPDREPWALVQELRETSEARRIPILALIPDFDETAMDQAVTAGATAALAWPPRTEELLGLVSGISRLVEERDDCRRRALENAVLLEMTTLLARTGEPERKLSEAASRISSLIPLSSCSFVVLSEDQTRGYVATGAANFVDDEDPQQSVIELAKIPEFQQAVREGVPLLQDGVAYDPLEITLSQDDASDDSPADRAYALFPIHHRYEVQGLLVVHLPVLAGTLDKADMRFLTRAAESCAQLIADMRRGRDARLAAERPSAQDSGIFRISDSDETMEEQKLLANLVEHSADAIVAADMTGTIMIFNRSAERLFGYTATEVIGSLDVANLFLPGGSVELMRILRSSDLGEPGNVHNLQTEVLSAQGEIIPVSLSAAMLYEATEEVATVVMIQDLRQRLALENRLQEIAAQLVESEKQATLAVLAGTAAHELNQPLTTIMGLVEMLQFQVEDDPKLSGQLDRVYAETERMSAIVRRIGKITKFTTTSYVGDTKILDLDKASE